MEIKFDIDNFIGKSENLISVLSHLKYAKCYAPVHDEKIEGITCRTPSSALKFCRYVNDKIGISPESEKVFLKNPVLGLRYLKMMRRESFLDPAVQKRFWKRVVKNPELALDWSRAFNKRLSEDEEVVFVKDMRAMKEYAVHAIRGKFSEKVHQMILLKSFEPLSQFHKNQLRDYLKFVE